MSLVIDTDKLRTDRALIMMWSLIRVPNIRFELFIKFKYLFNGLNLNENLDD